MQSILFAYSGGLDSVVFLHWLSATGKKVIAYTSQFGSQNLIDNKHALHNGAVEWIVEDMRGKWLKDIVTKARLMDSIYGGYLLHVALAKITIAQRLVNIAQDKGIELVSHGAHKGENDYYRLKKYISHLAEQNNSPITIYSSDQDPAFYRKFGKDRKRLLLYLKKHGLIADNPFGDVMTSEPTIMGVNYENGILQNIEEEPSHLDFFKVSSQIPVRVCLYFMHGKISKAVIGNKVYFDLLSIVKNLNNLGLKRGIGYTDTIEQNICGTKARCVYIQPANYIWHVAHMELGNLVLDKETLCRRDYISRRSGYLIYHGDWYSQELQSLMKEAVKYNLSFNGWVKMVLFPGFLRIIGRGHSNV